jgi:hypothetical protein
MHIRTQTVLAAALLMGAPFLVGQEAAETAPPDPPKSEIEQLKQELQEIKDRLDKNATLNDTQGIQTDLENFKYQYQRDRDTKSALSNRNLLITGLVQTRFAYDSDNISTPVATNLADTSVYNPPVVKDRRSTFDTPNGIVYFSGLLYRDYEKARNLGFLFSLAASPSTSNIGNTSTTTSVNSFLTVLDADLTYQALPTIENDGDRLSFTMGQQLVPFGLECFTTEELKPVINNALFEAATGFNQRQVGLIGSGQFFAQYDFGYNYRQALLNVAFGLVNGNGPNRDDDNNYKDRIYRLAVTVPAEYQSWLRELRVGASLYQGEGNVTDTNNVFLGYGPKNRYGYDVYYNHFPFGFTYEHVRLADGIQSGTKVGRLDRSGSTATFFYSFGEQFLNSIKNQGKFNDWWPKTYQPFVRFDTFNNNTNQSGQKITITTYGFNIFFAETTKAQINYNRRVQQNGSSPDIKSNELLAQLQFGF